ncbi:MAG: D-glycero-beta-D-manno-heptose 1-phosphate adenylyltransferase [Oligoflexia bacterium]|nr:D-glycero-beta-D-manno-heptose 1-phosphate adenylyltransferase [Oligoflexia bacterium]
MPKKPIASFTAKIKSPDALARALAAARKEGKCAVFTNGCFDLIHKGHVTYLEKAKKLGDLLVVALDTDESVKSLKGKGRPINTLADRMEVIAALGSVDYVTWFENSDPAPLIRKLKPYFLVKGGDWKPESIRGAQDVLASGGKVKSLPYVEGRSTTKMLERARGNK